MYKVSGSNLFGQWLVDELVFNNFQDISVSKQANLNCNPAQIKLVYMNWAYNIFQIGNSYYLSGSWRGNENKFIKLDLPEECNNLPDRSLMITGNDYNLILINRNTRAIWCISLEKEDEIKKLSLNIDTPIKKSIHGKKLRIDDKIAKIVATNNSCLYLTTEGNLYSGLLPGYLDTSHCIGKITDVTCGYEHFILLTNAGRVYTWGNGRRLQLGHGDVTNLETPTEVEALAGIKITKISAGGWHSLALSEFGDLYTWGWNDTGQLGIKSCPNNSQGVLNTEGLKSYPLPTLIDLFDENDTEINLNVKDIACGSRHSAILLEDNSVWVTGCNKYGQAGMSPEIQKTISYFKKTFQHVSKSILKCGPWSTILLKQ